MPPPLSARARVLLALLLPFAAFALGCARRIECRVHGGQRWLELESEHFRVRTNLDEPEARTTLERLEALFRGLRGIHGADISSSHRIEVVVLTSLGELSEFTEHAAGYAAAGERLVFTAEKGDNEYLRKAKPRWRLSSTLAHELAHHVHSHAYPRRTRWVAEGLATFEETIELNEDGSRILLGTESSERLHNVYGYGALGLDQLWAWDFATTDDQELSGRRYASAWIWIHFLHNRRREDLERWLSRLEQAEEPRAAFDAVFGSDYAALHRALDDYIRERSYQIWEYPVRTQNRHLAVRELAPALVHLVRADLFLSAPGATSREARRARARREIEAAQAVDATEFGVRLRAAELVEEPEERRAAAELLVAGAPHQAEAWYFLGGLLDVKKDGARRREALQKAVELAPDNPDFLIRLAWDLLRGRGDVPGGLAHAERAMKSAPWSDTAAEVLAAAHFMGGNCPSALATQRRSVALAAEGASSERRQKLLARAEEWDAYCAKREGASAPPGGAPRPRAEAEGEPE